MGNETTNKKYLHQHKELQENLLTDIVHPKQNLQTGRIKGNIIDCLRQMDLPKQKSGTPAPL